MNARSPRRRMLAAATALALLAGCVTTNLPPISAAGPDFAPLGDELALWGEARAEEEALLAAVDLYDDPLLEDYLESVVARLNPEPMAANPEIAYRVRVVADPSLNAFAYPHGSLYVHTGLLARLDDEDQVATVLGHEMSHVEYRHMLRHRRAAQNRAVAIGVAAVTAAVVLAGEEADAWHDGDWGKAAAIGTLGDLVVGLGLGLAFMAAVNGYGRDLELEADQHGFEKLAAAGYDPAAAPRMYEALLAGADRRDGRLATFFFGSHPRLTERIASAAEWAGTRAEARPAPDGAGWSESARTFRRRIGPLVRDNAVLHLEAGELDVAEEDLLRALEWNPDDPVAHFQLARVDLARAAGEPDPGRRDAFRGSARAALAESIAADPDLPAPHRELGLLLYGDGDFAGACDEFRLYLAADPGAEDAHRFRDYVREIRDHCGDNPLSSRGA